MRYLVALIVACFVLAIGEWFVLDTHRTLKTKVWQRLQALKLQGKLRAEYDVESPEQIDLGRYGMKLSSGMQTRIGVYHLLELRYFWIPWCSSSALASLRSPGDLRTRLNRHIA
jgi:hypothetical protein